jgi:hypothetical protein
MSRRQRRSAGGDRPYRNDGNPDCYFAGREISTLHHCHSDRCLLCGGKGGDTILVVEIINHPTYGPATAKRTIANKLCPTCAGKHVPVSPPMAKLLDRLTDEYWKEFRTGSCPGCNPDLQWHEGSAGLWPVH